MLAVVLGGGGVAAASPTPMVHPPDGWRPDAEQAAEIAKSVTTARPFTDPAATVAAEVYAPAGGAKISLVVSRATSRDPKLMRAEATRAAVDDLRAIVTRARLSGGKPVEDVWSPTADEGDKQVQASLAWHDGEAGTREDAAIVLAQDAATIVSVTGECVAAADAPAALVTACKLALATLDPGIAKASRIMIPAPTTAAPAAAAEDPSPSPPTPLKPQATMGDGSRITLPTMVIPQDAPTDRRPVYVGLGVMLLAAAFYWNRRNRERFLPEEDKPDDR